MTTATEQNEKRIIAPPMTDAEYYADYSAVSNSMLKVFRQSPSLYHEIYVAKTREPKPPTSDMIFGNLVHTLWLQPELFDSRYAVVPECDRRTTEGKERWSDFIGAADGKTLIESNDYDLANDMVKSLRGNPIARALREVAEPIVEQPIYWEERVGDKIISAKAKPDIVVRKGITEWNLCVDYKTSKSAGLGFSRQAANLGYHRQGEWYLKGCRAIYGTDAPWKFISLAQSKEPPHDIYPYHLGREWMSAGFDENAELLIRLAYCMESGEWTTPEQKTITELPMPNWLKYTT